MLTLTIALAAAVVLAAIFWVKWTEKKEELAAQHKAHDATFSRLAEVIRQQHEAWAKDSAAWSIRLSQARASMVEISAIISRRPAKRRWLAMVREVAQIASRGV